MKQVWEKIVEGILTCSGFITSITIVLIVIFLFTEAFGLFGNKVTEEGYVLAVNGKNPVRELSAVQIKDVFDEEITNWSEVGGPDIGIKVFRLEDITSYFSEEELGAEYDKAGECIGKVVADHPGIIAFVPAKFIEKDFPGRLLKDEHISFSEVFAGKEWFPTATPAPQFGFVPLVMGTLWVSFFAILFALPFGLSVAVYMSEVASSRTRGFLKPVIEWYTVGGIRILRADSYCTSHSKGVRFAGGRDRFGWKHCVGYYGFAYYYHGQRGCYA